MQLFYEILPIFLFFITFKFYGIYVATTVAIVATLLQVLITRMRTKKWDKMQVITLIVFLIFGGMTLYFHNPIFVKWKPTIVFWIFGLAILISQWVTKKPLIQRFMENMLQGNGTVPFPVWKKLNLMWACFFIGLGSINLYIAYCFSDNAWVNFKFYGITGALFLFSIFQAFYLMRYLTGPLEK